MLKKLASHLGEYRRAAIITPLLSALEAIMDVLLPLLMSYIIDLGIEKGDMNAVVKYGLLTLLVAAFALLLACRPAALRPAPRQATPATCATPCSSASSIIPSPTSTSSRRRALSPV